MIRLLSIPCLAVALSGCATAPPERTAAPRTVVEFEAGKVLHFDFNPESGVSTDSVRVPAAVAWAAVPQAYARYGLGTTAHAEARVVTSESRARRTLGGVRISQMLECGSPLGVKRADHYTVRLLLATRVDSVAPGLSVLRTRVQATGHDPAGNSNVVTCETKGYLEKAIADAVQELAK